MRLPDSAYTSRPWRIHEIGDDFELEDVWELPAVGRRDEFHLLVERLATGEPGEGASLPIRAIWALRWWLGRLLGWDDANTGIGARVPTLRDRLPADLETAPRGPDFHGAPFSSVYLLDDEFAAEIANRTVHGVMHIGWVGNGDGSYRPQMAVLVKPNGLFGRAYMAAIKPFRHLLVYPALMRQIEREWRERPANVPPPGV